MLKSVGHKISAILGLFVIFILVIVFATYLEVDSQKDVGRIINIAARQGMLTELMANEVHGAYRQTQIFGYQEKHGDSCFQCHDKNLVESDEVKKYKDQRGKTADMFNCSLRALIEGGKVPWSGNQVVVLPSTTDKAVLSQMEKVRSSWSDFYQAV